jgi:hypothetical protein
MPLSFFKKNKHREKWVFFAVTPPPREAPRFLIGHVCRVSHPVIFLQEEDEMIYYKTYQSGREYVKECRVAVLSLLGPTPLFFSLLLQCQSLFMDHV